MNASSSIWLAAVGGLAAIVLSVPAHAGACCFDDGSCQEVSSGECADLGGTYQGDAGGCESIECAGACYFMTDGVCLDDMWPELCDTLGGIYAGFGTDCQMLMALPAGACCFYDGGCNLLCEVVSQTLCDAVDGIYQGEGSDCDPNPCEDFGACCFAVDLHCEDKQIEQDCIDMGGYWQGACTFCADVTCPVAAACCFADGACLELTHDDCVAQGGVYQGFGNACTSTDCTGACCFDDGTCLEDKTANECEVDLGGNFLGHGSICTPDFCPAECQVRTYSFSQTKEPQFVVLEDFLKFDTMGDLRILEAVTVELDGQIVARVVLTNLGAVPVTTELEKTEYLAINDFPTLTPPALIGIDVFEIIYCNDPFYELPPGMSCDYGSPLVFPTVTTGSVNVMDLNQFIGPGTFDVQLEANGSFFYGGSNYNLLQSPHNAEGSVRVCYEYSMAGACCFCDGSCIVLPEEDCEALSDPVNNPWSVSWHMGLTCDEVTCDPVGACCLCDGQCDDELTQVECDTWAGSLGLYVHSFSSCMTCDEVDCQPRGACCLCDGQCQDDLTQIECDDWAASEGVTIYSWHECLTCADITCDPIGACCLCDGQCDDGLTEIECDDWAASQGVTIYSWHECMTCAEVGCEPIGACCLCDGQCDDGLTEIECDDWAAGQGVTIYSWYECLTCADITCDPIGACCLCDGQCDDGLTEIECDDWAASEGVTIYSWHECMTCADVGCEPIGACCLCDGQCDDGLSQLECDAWATSEGVTIYSWYECMTCADITCDPIGACCLCDGQCDDGLTETECDEWAASQGLWVQGWYVCMTCADITCDPVGACCFCDTTCQLLTEAECLALDGEYQGDCVTCAEVDCEGWGACCLCEDPWCIADISEAECDTYPDSFYLGHCTDCGDCPPFGACCLCDETCEDCVTEIECINMAGRFQGAGTTCATVICDGWGACCFPDGSCDPDLTEAECLAQGGQYQGDCSDCSDCEGKGGCLEKGSLLFFSKVELRWDYMGYLIQDTFLSLTNDYPDDVWVQMYFINGDPPLEGGENERPHPGWNWVDNRIRLTANQPIYWSALTGQPSNVSPFTILDPGDPPGRPAMDGTNDRVLRGYVVAWAVNDENTDEIKWNHLAGNGTLINYGGGAGWEYKACAFQVVIEDHIVAHGEDTGTPGVLNLDGSEYGKCADLLLMNFQAVGSSAYSMEGANQVISNTDLTLHPASADLRQNNDGPTATKADIDIWNQWEAHFSSHRCIACWDQTLLEFYSIPNHFLVYTLQTDHGKARFNGVAFELCNLDLDGDGVDDVVAEPAALLGLVAKLLTIDGGANHASAGTTLFGMGGQNAQLMWDVEEGGPPPGPDLPTDPTKDDLLNFLNQFLETMEGQRTDR